VDVYGVSEIRLAGEDARTMCSLWLLGEDEHRQMTESALGMGSQRRRGCERGRGREGSCWCRWTIWVPFLHVAHSAGTVPERGKGAST
jgi:hypothetical protein